MKPDYGSVKDILPVGDGSDYSPIEVYYKGELIKNLRQFSIRVRVVNAEEELKQYLQFSDELQAKKKENKLVLGTDDPSYSPAFRVEFPKKDYKIDQHGNKVATPGYFVIKTWTEII